MNLTSISSRKLSYKRLIIFLTFTLNIFLSLQCSKSGPKVEGGLELGETGAVRIVDPQIIPVEQKYLSAENPGNWKDEVQTHEPLVYAKKTGEKHVWQIEASMGFSGESARGKFAHYVEWFILVNNSHQELEKITFPLGTPMARAVFKYKRNVNERIFVIGKCNMHDSWMSEVKFP